MGPASFFFFLFFFPPPTCIGCKQIPQYAACRAARTGAVYASVAIGEATREEKFAAKSERRRGVCTCVYTADNGESTLYIAVVFGVTDARVGAELSWEGRLATTSLSGFLETSNTPFLGAGAVADGDF